MLNAIPVFGWLLSLAFTVSLSLPFWICWTLYGIGRTYFYWLPPVYLSIGFWDCVALFTVISILKSSLTPKFADQTVNTGDKK